MVSAIGTRTVDKQRRALGKVRRYLQELAAWPADAIIKVLVQKGLPQHVSIERRGTACLATPPPQPDDDAPRDAPVLAAILTILQHVAPPRRTNATITITVRAGIPDPDPTWVEFEELGG